MNARCERGTCRDDATQVVRSHARAMPAAARAGSFGRDFTRIPARSSGKSDAQVAPVSRDYTGPLAGPAEPPRLSYATVRRVADDCGAFEWVAQWKLSAPATNGGWIVQKVAYSPDITTCDGKRFTPGGDAGGLDASHYPVWEAWQVQRGQRVTIDAAGGDVEDDTFQSDAMNGTRGSFTMTGTAEYYDGLSLPADFVPTHREPTHDLPATRKQPALKGGTGSIHHGVTATWDCCKDAKSRKTVLS